MLLAHRLVENALVFVPLGGPEVDGSASVVRGNRLLTRAAPMDRPAHGRSLMCPQQPPLQKRGRAMHAGRPFARRLVASADDRDLVSAALLGDVVTALPAVRVNQRPGGGRFFDEAAPTLAGDVGRPSEPDAAAPPPVLLGRDDKDRLLFGLSAADAFLLSTGAGFIRLPKALSPSPPDHRTLRLVEPTPSCLAAAQAERLVKPQRTPSGLLASQAPHRLQPHSWGLLRPFKKRPRRQRGSAPALAALQVARVRQPGLAADTLRAAEAPPPPNPPRIRRTRRFRGEPIVELQQGSAGFWDSQRRP